MRAGLATVKLPGCDLSASFSVSLTMTFAALLGHVEGFDAVRRRLRQRHGSPERCG